MKIILHSLAALAAGGFCFAAVAAEPPKIVMEEFMVPSGDPGIRLYVRNKHPQGAKNFPGDRILLFVHGATYPAETSFDLRLNGVSWMDYIARRGYDVYLVDVRGYGKSTRPPEMEQPPEQNAPIVRTETAVRDVGAAADFIRERRGVARINLMGWSWGTTAASTGARASRSTIRLRSAFRLSSPMPNGTRTCRATCSTPTSPSSSTPRTSVTSRSARARTR